MEEFHSSSSGHWATVLEASHHRYVRGYHDGPVEMRVSFLTFWSTSLLFESGTPSLLSASCGLWKERMLAR